MAKQPRPPSPSSGFTLIEMLVVLAIIAALSIAFVNSIGSKSPRAVKTGLLDLKLAMQEARQAAVSSGRNINLVITDSGEQAKIEAYLAQPDGTTITDTANAAYIAPVASKSFDKSWRRYAQFVGDLSNFTDEVSPIKDIPALTTFNFSGWATPLELGNTKFGFSPTGSPQALTDSGKTRSEIAGGVWIGVRGIRVNEKGYPYGAVFITQRGQIIAFYKPDMKLDTTEHKWQRME